MAIAEQTERGAQLSLSNLTVELGGRDVLVDIDLSVAPGQFITVVGRSGSGKTTLLRVLAGLQAATHGDVSLTARPIVVFQEPRLLPWRTVLQNVCVGMKSPDLQAATRVLEQVGLADRANDYPGVLSGGQRQRNALARALMHHPKLLLLDEPFGALDALTRISQQRLVEQLWRERGFTAVLVTHDVDEAVMLADRALVINDGRIVHDVVVDLPRPRVRNSPEVGRYAASLLAAIFGEEQASTPVSRTDEHAAVHARQSGAWPVESGVLSETR
jgi:sulfonate transport system ATP-binding protein